MDSKAFKDGMARLGAAVNVITTAGPAGQCGFTASAVCSVSAEPPTLLVCMNQSSTQTSAFRKNKVLCVNALAAGQEDLSNVFAGFTGLDMPARFAHGQSDTLVTGAPALVGSVVSFDCEVERIVRSGSHNVFFCRVVAVTAAATPRALMYFHRAYHTVGALSSAA